MILKEGAIPIVTTLLVTVVVTNLFGFVLSLPLWVLLVWLSKVYWEHRPQLPAEPKGVLSPISGRVSKVDSQFDPWLKRETLRIRIRIPFPGIVPLRSPVEAKVMDMYALVGAFGNEQRACGINESPDCYAQWLRTDEEEDVVFVVSSRLPLSRARFDQAPGERVGHGARSGFIYFASIVDILIPQDARASVAVGEAVRAGESVVAKLPGSH